MSKRKNSNVRDIVHEQRREGLRQRAATWSPNGERKSPKRDRRRARQKLRKGDW